MYDTSSMEKRAMRRFALQLPVVVVAQSGEVVRATAESRDVSSDGICFLCDTAMEPETAIEFVLTLPAEVTMLEPITVRCSGKVVRVERQGREKFAVAAAISKYEYMPRAERGFPEHGFPRAMSGDRIGEAEASEPARWG